MKCISYATNSSLYYMSTHFVTVMNLKFDIYFLHSLHQQFFGLHFLLPFLKVLKFVISFNSKGAISSIYNIASM